MDKTKQLEELVALAVEMRKAQKEYFRTRDYVALSKSKSLERKFDDEVKRYQDGAQQPSLF